MHRPSPSLSCLHASISDLPPGCRAWRWREGWSFGWRQLAYLRRDFAAIRRADPALAGKPGGRLEALLYPSLGAIAVHRVAHLLYAAGLPVLPRLLNFAARFLTGVDIHPGARLGPGLFIDHGDGVVIGETAEVGRDVVLLHQVTLGGRGGGRGKRHPTVGDGAFLGAGAKVLGAVQLGAGSRIGANAVVLTDVPPGATAVGIPARIVRRLPVVAAFRPERCCGEPGAAAPEDAALLV